MCDDCHPTCVDCGEELDLAQAVLCSAQKAVIDIENAAAMLKGLNSAMKTAVAAAERALALAEAEVMENEIEFDREMMNPQSKKQKTPQTKDDGDSKAASKINDGNTNTMRATGTAQKKEQVSNKIPKRALEKVDHEVNEATAMVEPEPKKQKRKDKRKTKN